MTFETHMQILKTASKFTWWWTPVISASAMVTQQDSVSKINKSEACVTRPTIGFQQIIKLFQLFKILHFKNVSHAGR